MTTSGNGDAARNRATGGIETRSSCETRGTETSGAERSEAET
ncbi:hypothetical protein [Halorubrum sp. BV1]|nr:hypothetical protein [Halorubrum sp. BV1]